MVSVSEGEDLFEGCRLNLFCNDVRIYMITLTITYGHTATNNEGKEVKKRNEREKNSYHKVRKGFEYASQPEDFSEISSRCIPQEKRASQ